jgi:hypothetical protein
MQARQLLQASISLACQLHFDPAAVGATDASPDQPRNRASRDQRHDPVMLCLEALRQLSYRRPFAPGKALDLEHQKILQRGDALPVRHLFAEVKIAAQLVANWAVPKSSFDMWWSASHA